ncbi:MAG: hypothetical protein ACRDLM_01940 [Gaiellaceae bacterium]
MFARVLIWNLFDSKTTLGELLEHLPELPEGSYWITSEASDRFGVLCVGEELPDLGAVPDLIGAEPTVAEEFDVVE